MTELPHEQLSPIDDHIESDFDDLNVGSGLSEQEKERNYRENLLHMTGALSKSVDAIHSLFGQVENDTLPENVSKPVYNRLVLDIKKLEEVIEQLKKGNPNLKDENVNE